MFIKEFRVSIDTVLNSFPYIRSSREVSLAYTSLQRSFMWLGESLKFLGEKSPYTESHNPKSDIIEPTAEHQEANLLPRWNDIEVTQTARIKDLRAHLQSMIDSFTAWRKESESAGPEYADCLDNSFNALKEAKMWFGWELARIKKVKEGDPNTSTAVTQELPL